MTHYFKSGNTVNVEPSDALDVLDHLPAGTYTVKENPQTKRLYLQTTDNMTLPKKVYGDPSVRADRILRTFNDRSKSTGVLLSGDKGSGKTLLCKVLANRMVAANMPVIIVDEPFHGPAFNSLIGNIKDPAMVFFDEFDKLYDEEGQEALLTLLDGTVETKKMFVLTTNSGHVDEHLINRPGRIFYRFAYRGLDESFVEEYADDVLKNLANKTQLTRIANAFGSFTFDMLQALVEEMNRYDIDAMSAMEGLNVKIEDDSVVYDVTVLFNGAPITNSIYPTQYHQNPLIATTRRLEIYTNDKHTIKDDVELDDIILNEKTLIKTSGTSMTFKHETDAGEILVILSKHEPKQYNWNAF